MNATSFSILYIYIIRLFAATLESLIKVLYRWASIEHNR